MRNIERVGDEELLRHANLLEPGESRRTAKLVTMSDVKAEAVQWLWHPYIPCGKLTLLEGDPAAGKTWLALAIAARVTSEHKNVLYLTAEDGLADTLRPRLDAVGADCQCVHVLQSTNTGAAVSLSDIDVLGDALTRTGAGLVVVDPLQAYLGATVDMHRANETRPVLSGLAGLAEKHGCAVLLIRHLTKAQSDRAIYRGLGSIDLTAAARSVLLAGKDPHDASGRKRAVVQTKNSLAAEGPGLGYAIEQDRFAWTGDTDLTAAALLAADATDDERSARDEAREFLTEVLAEGPVASKTIIRQAHQRGITEATLRRARTAMCVVTGRVGFGPGSEVRWSLPHTRSQTLRAHVCDESEAEAETNVSAAGTSVDSAYLLSSQVPTSDEQVCDEAEERF